MHVGEKFVCTGTCISAAEWKLDEPDWTGRLKAVSKGSEVVLKLEDVSTGLSAGVCLLTKR